MADCGFSSLEGMIVQRRLMPVVSGAEAVITERLAGNDLGIATMTFDLHIGIDYSGRETTHTRTPALQVFASFDGQESRPIVSPSSSEKLYKNWCRKEIADWLIEQAQKKITFIAGIDHGFSFPRSYFQRYDLPSWDSFLDDFCEHWPTDTDHIYVDFVREKNPPRTGTNDEFRLTEQWTSSAKSVFQFDGQGSAAKSAHAGIPWLRRIRRVVGDRVHFWPFDGWDVPAGKSVLVEGYSSLFRNRFPVGDRFSDQQDAYAVARWLSEMDRTGFLAGYFSPPLTEKQKLMADLEGWILGVR